MQKKRKKNGEMKNIDKEKKKKNVENEKCRKMKNIEKYHHTWR